MSGVIELWASWLALASIHVCLLLVLALLLERICGCRMNASLRTMIWSAVLLRVLIPPLPAAWTLATITAPSTLDSGWFTSSADLHSTADAGAAWFAIWLAGSLASAVLALRSYRRSLRGVKRCGAGVSPAVKSTAEAAARDLGLARVPRLVITPAPTPYVVGAFRPIVVLPVALQDERHDVLRHVLLHEFAHVKRRDTLAASISAVLQVLYWFHPGVWFAARRLSTCRELACDALAARVAGSAADYRRTLLDMARPLTTVPAGVGLFGAGELITRLVALEAEATLPSRRQRLTSAVVGVLLLTVSAAAVGYARPTLDPEAMDLSAAGCLRLRYAVYAMLAQEAAASEGR